MSFYAITRKWSIRTKNCLQQRVWPLVQKRNIFLNEKGYPPAPTFIKKQRQNQRDQDRVQRSATAKVAVTERF